MKINFFCIAIFLTLLVTSSFANPVNKHIREQPSVEDDEALILSCQDVGCPDEVLAARERKRIHLIEERNASFQRFIEEDRQMNADDNAIIDSCKLTAGCRCGMNDSCFAARQRINQRRMDKEDARHRNDAEKRQIEFNKKLSDFGLPPMPPIRDH